MDQKLIQQGKYCIKNADLQGLQNMYQEIQNHDKEYSINIPMIFKELFFYACIQQNREMILFLLKVFDSFDPVLHTALRQMFPYGKTLIRDKEWYESKTSQYKNKFI